MPRIASRARCAAWMEFADMECTGLTLECERGAVYGAPGRARTCDLLIRSQTLYPTELRVHAGMVNGSPRMVKARSTLRLHDLADVAHQLVDLVRAEFVLERRHVFLTVRDRLH